MSLFKNAAFNFAGAFVPAVAALLSVPVLVRCLGTTHYGVFVLVTAVVGYFAVLDVNATAGSVKYIAQHRAAGDALSARKVLSFGALLYVLIGLVGGALVALFAQPLATQLFNIPPEVQPEAISALRWSGLAFFCGQVQAYLHSVPQALQRYDLTGRMEAVFGTAVALVSMAAAWAGAGLVGIVVLRLVLSLVNIAFLVGVIRRVMTEAGWSRPDRDTVKRLGSFSLFSYLSKLAAISAAHTDKLVIGAMVDMKALAWYSVPFLLISRVYSLAFRLAHVMFPRASALAAAGQMDQLRRNYLDATRYVMAVNASLLLLLVSLAPELMHHWAGPEFGHVAVQLMLFLAFAVFLDSLSNLPSLVNDGLGHPSVTGISAVVRAGVGIAAAVVGVRAFGILGAAMAQLLVSSLASLLFLPYVHGRTVPIGLADVFRQSWLPSLPLVALAGLLGAYALNRSVFGLAAAAALLLGLLLVLLVYAWFLVLLPEHKARLRAQVLRRFQPTGGAA